MLSWTKFQDMCKENSSFEKTLQKKSKVRVSYTQDTQKVICI